MRTKNMLLTAVVIGLAVVAGLLGVGGTWALWNASVQSSPGTVQSADFKITVNGSSIPEGATEVSVTPENAQARLTPSSKVYVAVTVGNAVNAGGPFAVNATLGDPTGRDTGTGTGLHHYLTLRTSPLSDSAETCAASTYTTAPPEGWSARIEKDSSATFCLEVGLTSAAPSPPSGTTVTIDLPLSVEQIQAGA
ncbi:MAG: SipW-dependent-type signal peptide-containing protein [Micrococcus sp.]|nr:SipW-dependent-type signal peptide-containing protein [Micrococcus sp.]